MQHIIEDAGGASLVILDPIVAVARTDSHKNAETRRDLQPVVDMAEELNVAILGVHHLTKGTEGRAPIDRVTGSVAFGAVPRVVWASVQQKADEDGNPGSRVLTRAKSNLGPDQGGWAYELQIVTLSLNPLIDATVVVFGEFVDGSARDILAEAEGIVDPGAASAQQEATDFLRDFLGTGARPAKLAQTEARGAGHSPRTLARAKSRLGVRSVKGSLYGGWLWELPKDAKSP